MANVLFKRGLLASLPTTKTDGVFYLTTDSGRLYADYYDNNNVLDRHLLNQTIQFKDSISALTSMSNSWTAAEKAAHVQDIYYVKTGADSVSGNILAVWTVENGNYRWVQINPDTNDYIESMSLGATTASNDIATIALSATDTKSNSITATMSVVGGTGVHVAASDGTLTISGTTYDLSESLSNDSKAITISLGNSDTTATSDVRLTAGSNVTFATATNAISISAHDTVIETVSVSSSTAGSLSVTLTDAESNSTTGTLSNLGVGLNDGSFVLLDRFTSGSAGSIYSKAEIDNMMAGLDGMKFIGTIANSGGTTTALPTTNVHRGDVYVVGGDITFPAGTNWVPSTGPTNENPPRTGDMVIATGTEGSDGTITTQSLQWVYVPAGNDAIDAFSYSGSVTTATNTVSMSNELGNGIAGISLVSGTGMAVTSSSTKINVLDDASDNLLITTISHATVSTTTTTASPLTGSAASFTAVKGLTIDNGHVTGIELDTFTPAVQGIDDITTTASTTAATATFNVIDSEGNQGETAKNLNFESSSILFGTNTATSAITMNLVWGTF